MLISNVSGFAKKRINPLVKKERPDGFALVGAI